MPGQSGHGQEPLHIRNEFAAVELRAVPYGRGARLEITAGRVERTGLIDATVLEALTLLRESQLMQIVAMATDPESEGPRPIDPGPEPGPSR